MGYRVADDFCGVHFRVCGERAERTERRERGWFSFWSHRIWVHDFRSAAGRAKAGANVADWTRAGLDARALVAGVAEPTDDFVSWRISFWRHSDQRADVAADYYGGERSVWSGIAALRTAGDDDGREAGNDLRRDWECAETIAGRGGPRCRDDLRVAGDRKIRERGWPACGRIQRDTVDGDNKRRRGGSGRRRDCCAYRGGVRASAKVLFERDAAVPRASEVARI